MHRIMIELWSPNIQVKVTPTLQKYTIYQRQHYALEAKGTNEGGGHAKGQAHENNL